MEFLSSPVSTDDQVKYKLRTSGEKQSSRGNVIGFPNALITVTEFPSPYRMGSGSRFSRANNLSLVDAELCLASSVYEANPILIIKEAFV